MVTVGLKTGSYKTASGKSYSVRETPASERKYPVPTRLTASQGGGSINYVSTGSARSSVTDTGDKVETREYAGLSPGGRIVGGYARTTTTSSNQDYTEARPYTPVTPEDFSTRKPTERYQFDVDIRGDSSSFARRENNNNFTPGGSISEYKKPSAVREFATGFFTPTRETYRSLRDEGPVTARQAGAVAGFIGLGVSGSTGVFFGTSTKAVAITGNILSKANKLQQGIQTIRYGSLPIGKAAVYGAGMTATSYAGTTTIKNVAYETRDNAGFNYAQQREVYGFSESLAAPQYTKPLWEVKTLGEAVTFAKDTGKIIGYEATSLFGNQKLFESTAREEFIKRGATPEKADYLARSMGRERRIVGFTEAGMLVSLSSVTEKFGRASVSAASRRAVTISTQTPFKSGFKLGFKQLALPGFVEGSSFYVAQRTLRSQEMTPLGAVGFGLMGAATAGTLGGVQIGLNARSAVKGTRGSRFLSSSYDTVLNVADPTEKPGDLLRDFSEGIMTRTTGQRYPVTVARRTGNRASFISYTPSFTSTRTNTRTNTQSRGKTNVWTGLFTPTKTTQNTKTPSQTNIFTPTKTFTNTRTTTKSFLTTPTFTPTFTPTRTPTKTQITTNINTPDLPFPVIPPFGGVRGKGNFEGYRQRRMYSYAPSLSAVFSGVKASKSKKSRSLLSGFEFRGL